VQDIGLGDWLRRLVQDIGFWAPGHPWVPHGLEQQGAQGGIEPGFVCFRKAQSLTTRPFCAPGWFLGVLDLGSGFGFIPSPKPKHPCGGVYELVLPVASANGIGHLGLGLRFGIKVWD
jgi:hypothetical protein